jgi:hypothetical protein
MQTGRQAGLAAAAAAAALLACFCRIFLILVLFFSSLRAVAFARASVAKCKM